ncbi:glycine-rich cell wall structural protein-like [Melitaea cinxia]|uniref:glycine-rich cell wall structural protein-like n=2 Tax=Melitaea cinxia TaxID=113334 RepID=UPI001E27182A|nr:glycine-rich cell wall structural protein-like [Melitaea cinxia]
MDTAAYGSLQDSCVAYPVLDSVHELSTLHRNMTLLESTTGDSSDFLCQFSDSLESAQRGNWLRPLDDVDDDDDAGRTGAGDTSNLMYRWSERVSTSVSTFHLSTLRAMAGVANVIKKYKQPLKLFAQSLTSFSGNVLTIEQIKVRSYEVVWQPCKIQEEQHEEAIQKKPTMKFFMIASLTLLVVMAVDSTDYESEESKGLGGGLGLSVAESDSETFGHSRAKKTGGGGSGAGAGSGSGGAGGGGAGAGAGSGSGGAGGGGAGAGAGSGSGGAGGGGAGAGAGSGSGAAGGGGSGAGAGSGSGGAGGGGAGAGAGSGSGGAGGSGAGAGAGSGSGGARGDGAGAGPCSGSC